MFIDFLSLFGLAFLSATLLPGGSELLLIHLSQQTQYQHAVITLWLVASLGNTLGSVVNYALGRYLLHYQDRRWFPIKSKQLIQSQGWFQKYGVWSLLLAWTPIIGDALTLIAGTMKVRFAVFVLLVFIGKSVRYAVLLGLLSGILAA